jgi:hypothetical protein
MAKEVVVIASGETERRAVPHLVAHLLAESINVVEVIIPPGNRALSVEMAERLIKAAYFLRIARPPDKFVVLLDVDDKDPAEVLKPFLRHLPHRLGIKIDAQLTIAFAQWHLEAWYFADEPGLRTFLKRALGNVDTSKPDEIRNPKLHLKHLLGARIYTAVISEEIATLLDVQVIYKKSPSYKGFIEAIRNGSANALAEPDHSDS